MQMMQQCKHSQHDVLTGDDSHVVQAHAAESFVVYTGQEALTIHAATE